MGKRVRISNESVNSYGFRVLTAGMDVSQYLRNPVMLYMHQRGQVIGYMKDVQVEGDEVTGEPVFDEATELSQRCKKQFEFGSLKMVSAGLEILDTSTDEATLARGQKRPTVTRCRLFEVSMVDIGSNDDAIALKMGGRCVNLAGGDECPLPLIETLSNPIQTNPNMELKELALKLGLKETATEAEVNASIDALRHDASEKQKAELALKQMQERQVEALVSGAVASRRIDEARRKEFAELGAQIGAEKLQRVLEAMQPAVKLSTLVSPKDDPAGATPQAYKKLGDVPADQIMQLKKEQPEEYRRLYREEYGMDF